MPVKMIKVLILILSLFLPGFSQYPASREKALHDTDITATQRERMVQNQLSARGIRDKRVLGAMGKIPRHLFVDESMKGRAYGDHPLPIAEGQTISQPYVVAWMSGALDLKPHYRVLEIGTGSGYQAAVLAEIVKEVYTIEIREGLSESAAELLHGLGYKNVRTKHADGYFGWEEYAPFDAIIITASANHIPPPLIKQLKDGGQLVIPLGSTLYYQVLTLVTRAGEDLSVEQMGGVAFVPMVGEVRK